MEFFAQNEDVERLQAALPQAGGLHQLELQLQLAWQLRQRDTKRALQLVEQIQTTLGSTDLPRTDLKRILLRLSLIEGEAKWLNAELDQAGQLAALVADEAARQDDWLCCIDAHWLGAWVAIDAGQIANRDAALHAMLALARSHDPVRASIAESTLVRFGVFRHPERCRSQLDQIAPNTHPAAQCSLEDTQGVMAGFDSDFAKAVRHWNQAFTLALATGQIRRAIVTATNIGNALTSLNEYPTALEWMQRSLDLANQGGWPKTMGMALTQTAEGMRLMHRYDAAHELLCAALKHLEPMSASRDYTAAMIFLGNVELDRQDYQSAKRTFEALAARSEATHQSDLLSASQRGLAQALLQLGQPHAAWQAAHAALSSHNAHADTKIATLRVLADIHVRHDLPAPEPMRAATPTLHYLQQALELAATIEGYTIPDELLDAVADEYAKLGQFEKAYLFGHQANLTRRKNHSQEANSRAMALQVNYQTERARAEGEHHRQLAKAEAERAAVLQQTSETLAFLGTIGQEITAHLDAKLIFEVLKRHIHHLLEVNTLVIYLCNPDGETLDLAFGVEAGTTLRPDRVRLDNLDSHTACCVRERREIAVDYAALPPSVRLIPGTQPTRSGLFSPLCLADDVLGAMSIQAFQHHAYGKREQLIFRTLCAYTAIALANARSHGELAAAHRHLQETQQQMVLQGKMAGLGTLTAGVAHEINNPTNFAHVAAQNLRVDLASFETCLTRLLEPDEAPEIVALFQQHFASLNEHVATILNGTERIKGIVRDLRAFTRPDEADKKSVAIRECLSSTLNLVRTSWLEQVEFVTDWQADPEIECWPALLNQVFMNLLVNGCQAIAEKFDPVPGQGQMRITLRQEGAMALIDIEDNGTGIPEEHQAHILEPFYTTKLVGAGTGLGLAIAYGIIHKHDGDLRFTSIPGQGSCFTVMLPLTSQRPG